MMALILIKSTYNKMTLLKNAGTFMHDCIRVSHVYCGQQRYKKGISVCEIDKIAVSLTDFEYKCID